MRRWPGSCDMNRKKSVRAARNQSAAVLGNLTGLLAKIKPAVAAATYTGERTSKNYAFVDAVARKNVEITMSDIRKDSPVLAAMESSGAIKIAGAMYNLETAVVDFLAG
jgi:carbonic anhydrase